LGPCHHVFLKVCGISQLDEYETPLGNIELNLDIIEELLQHKEFIPTDIDAEEEEFSLEVHLPFIRKVFKGFPLKIPLILKEKHQISSHNGWVIG